ncbi:MAG: hypothetical protein IT208_15515 [Chthonomonadales bacterium]|nr:hypothetical protein [Chthonomonadales bacterium]
MESRLIGGRGAAWTIPALACLLGLVLVVPSAAQAQSRSRRGGGSPSPSRTGGGDRGSIGRGGQERGEGRSYGGRARSDGGGVDRARLGGGDRGSRPNDTGSRERTWDRGSRPNDTGSRERAWDRGSRPNDAGSRERPRYYLDRGNQADRGDRGGQDRATAGDRRGGHERTPEDRRAGGDRYDRGGTSGLRRGGPRDSSSWRRDGDRHEGPRFEARRREMRSHLRPPHQFTDRRLDRYFPHRYAYYPHYAPPRASVEVYFSPFYFYYGVCPPYIYRSYGLYARPSVVYIDVPIYVGGAYRGYRDDDDGYYLERRYDDRWKDEPGLWRAVEDLRGAFTSGDIDQLASLTDPTIKIAVFGRGRYEYSVEASDYLDMTRDFFGAARTTGFEVYRVRPKTSGVYQVFAKHSYRNRDDETRDVYLCVVMERVRGDWTITQVDTSPDRIEN